MIQFEENLFYNFRFFLLKKEVEIRHRACNSSLKKCKNVNVKSKRI